MRHYVFPIIPFLLLLRSHDPVFLVLPFCLYISLSLCLYPSTFHFLYPFPFLFWYMSLSISFSFLTFIVVFLCSSPLDVLPEVSLLFCLLVHTAPFRPLFRVRCVCSLCCVCPHVFHDICFVSSVFLYFGSCLSPSFWVRISIRRFAFPSCSFEFLVFAIHVATPLRDQGRRTASK